MKLLNLGLLISLFSTITINHTYDYQKMIMNNHLNNHQYVNDLNKTNNVKHQNMVASIDFNLLNDDLKYVFNQSKASLITYEDIYNNLFEPIIFRFFSKQQYNDLSDYSQLGIFNIINELNESTNFNQLINDLFNQNPIIRYNDELGIINIKLKVRNNQNIKLYINEQYQNNYLQKPTKLFNITDELEFAIVNFKNTNQLWLSNQTINALDTNLANINASDPKFSEVVINSLCQFQDSMVLPKDKRILVTNFYKQYFISKYKPKIEIVESKFANAEVLCKLTLNLFDNNLYSSKIANEFFDAKSDVLYFNIVN